MEDGFKLWYNSVNVNSICGYGIWNGYMVYHVWAKKDEGACIGYPQYALEKDGVFRFAELEEIHAIMRRKTKFYIPA